MIPAAAAITTCNNTIIILLLISLTVTNTLLPQLFLPLLLWLLPRAASRLLMPVSIPPGFNKDQAWPPSKYQLSLLDMALNHFCGSLK